MRLLFVSGEYPPMQGGVGDYTRELGRALAKLGADVHVLTDVTAAQAGDEPSEPQVHARLKEKGWRLWGEVLRLAAELRPNVIHIQYQSAAYRLHPAINYLPWRLRLDRRHRRPLVFTTYHDIRVPYIFPKAGPLRRRAVLALAQHGDGAVVTNPADRDGLLAARLQLASRLYPIPIGSNIHPDLPPGYDRAAQRARWDAGPDDWLLAYFGFLNENKGGETLIAALSELARAGHPARLLMVGGQVGASDPTNAAYLTRVKGMIRDRGLEERVMWTGFTAPVEVSANLLAADCAVLPYREGASLRHGSLMAALAHGLPIVTTTPPGLSSATERHPEPKSFPQLVEGVSALLVRPDDPQALAHAVSRAMASPELRRRLSEGSRSLAHAFEWDTIAHAHLDMYAQVEKAAR